VTEALARQAERLGFDLCGVTPAVEAPHQQAYKEWIAKGYHGSMSYLKEQIPLKAHPEKILPGAKSVVAVALNYHQENPSVEGMPRVAAYALGRDYHKVIRGKLKRLGAWLEDEIPGSKSRPCVDSAPIFERDFAHLAGLGWFGKNTMLINSKRGSWFFLGLLLTTAELEPTQRAEGGCGNCRACVEACPTGAIVFEDDRWQIDSRRCISYLTIEHEGPVQENLSGWTFGCDVCQEVCPFNRPRENAPLRAQRTEEPDFLNRRPWPSLKELAEMTEAEWDELTRGSAIRRTGYEGLRRNALINLKQIR